MLDPRRGRLLAGSCIAVAAYLFWRRRMLRWGATEEEATGPLPGDDEVPHPRVQGTRAITIDAPPEEVWSWIVQMGIGRAGFYTHDWLERTLFGARYVEGRHSALRIHPELQDLKVGDLIPYGAGAFATVHEIERPSYLVAAEAFVLRELLESRTRLIVRYRGDGFVAPAIRTLASDAPWLSRALAAVITRTPGLMLLVRAFDFVVSDPLHHYMETGMLKGIKARAEGAAAAAHGTGGQQGR